MKSINLDTHRLPDPQICGWLEANGINPSHVPAAQVVTVDNGKLTYLQFLSTEDGHLQLAHHNDGSPYRPKETRTITLLSAPENHGL